jgi:hypothetical protein
MDSARSSILTLWGQVYRATDTRLIRTVAIKICAGPFSERSAQEAKLIAMRKYSDRVVRGRFN